MARPSVSSKAVSVWNVGGCFRFCHFWATEMEVSVRQAISVIPSILIVFIYFPLALVFLRGGRDAGVHNTSPPQMVYMGKALRKIRRKTLVCATAEVNCGIV